jgi:predicted transcriptional regulator
VAGHLPHEQKKPSADPGHDDVEYDAWFRAQAELGLAAAKAGMVCTDEDAGAVFSKLYKRALERSRNASG